MKLNSLLKSQNAQIVEAIRQSGLDRDLFQQVTTSANAQGQTWQIDAIKVANGAYFKFINVKGSFDSEWSPDKEKRVGQSLLSEGWEDQFNDFSNWLSYLKRELEAEESLSIGSGNEDVSSDRGDGESTSWLSSLEGESKHEYLLEFLAGLQGQHAKDWKDRLTTTAPTGTAPYLIDLREKLTSLYRLDLAGLPQAEIKRLVDWTQTYRELEARSLMSPQLAEEQIDLLKKDVERLYLAASMPLAALVCYLSSRGLDIKESVRALYKAEEDALASADKMRSLLEATQEASQKVTISDEAKRFSDEADAHLKSSRAWLVLIAVLLIITFLFALNNYSLATKISRESNLENLISTSEGIQLIVSKFVLYSLLVGAIVWAGKVYRSHRHNSVVNKHRANALSSFRAFVESTADDQVRNAILTHAAHCIYTPQSTGYVNSDSDFSSSPQIIEIVKDLGKLSK